MSQSPMILVTRAILHRAFLLAVLCLLVPTGIHAQFGSRDNTGGTGGNHTVQGKIFLPNGRSAEAGIRVVLDSPNSASVSTVTDNDGTFSFRSLMAGEYRVTVQGTKEFETAVESAYIYRESSPGGVAKTLNIQLKAKPGSSMDPMAGVPPAARDLYVQGIEAAKKNDTKQAIEHLNAAVQAYPQFKFAFNDLGLQYLKDGQAEKAAEAFTSAIKLAPEDYTPRVNLAMALHAQKKFDAAENELRQAIKLNTSLPAAHYYLGLALVNQKKFDEAEKEFETSINGGGENYSQAHRYLGALYARDGKNKQAAAELERYLKLEPKAPDAEKARAMIKDLQSKKQ